MRRTTALLVATLSVAACSTFGAADDPAPGSDAGDASSESSTAPPGVDAEILDASPSDAPSAGKVPPGGKIAFLSNGMFRPGSLMTIKSADALCATEAAAASLPGTYLAWMSSTAAGIGAVNRVGVGPWYLVDGAKVATRAELAVSKLAHGIDLLATKIRQPAGVTAVWTGTGMNGGLESGQDCTSWSSTNGNGLLGSFTATDARWTQSTQTSCALAARIYCFQND
jgi:hypothetical protein